MKRFFLMALVCLAVIPCVKAQEDERFEAGGFAEYYRSGVTGTNMFGLGGRVGVGVTPHLMIEGEMGYDFNRAFTDAFTNSSSGVSFITSGTKTLHGLIGPKWSLGHGPLHPFVEAKLGFINYMFNNEPVGFSSFVNQIQGLRQANVNAAIFYGGGLEGKLIGPLGLRIDVGDEVFFNHGPQNGLKATFGPIVRF